MSVVQTNRGLQRASFLLAAILFVIGIAGCAEGGMPGSSGLGTSPQQAAAVVNVCNRTPNGCVNGSSFSLAALRDISVKAQWSNVPQGTHTELMEFLAPGGAAYQTRHVAFVVGEADGGSTLIDTIVPVSGSMIQLRGVTGTWTVRVSLDGQIITTQDLEIQP